MYNHLPILPDMTMDRIRLARGISLYLFPPPTRVTASVRTVIGVSALSSVHLTCEMDNLSFWFRLEARYHQHCRSMPSLPPHPGKCPVLVCQAPCLVAPCSCSSYASPLEPKWAAVWTARHLVDELLRLAVDEPCPTHHAISVRVFPLRLATLLSLCSATQQQRAMAQSRQGQIDSATVRVLLPPGRDEDRHRRGAGQASAEVHCALRPRRPPQDGAVFSYSWLLNGQCSVHTACGVCVLARLSEQGLVG